MSFSYEREERGAEDRTRGMRRGVKKKTLKESWERKRDEDCHRTLGLVFWPSSFIRPLNLRCLVIKSNQQTDLLKESKRSYQTAKLDGFVEQLIVDNALLGVSRFPGQLDASVCNPTNFKLPWLAWDWKRQNQTVSQDSLIYLLVVYMFIYTYIYYI